MNDGLTQWSAHDEVLHLGPADQPGTSVLLPFPEMADRLAAEHNKQVTWARIKLAGEREGRARPATMDDVEALLVRVATATVRELLRGLLPARWCRRPARR